MKRTKLWKKKSMLDEMQEQKLLKIEHNGCWLAYWGLFISIFVQAVIYGRGEWKYMAGEWIVFMCLTLYIIVSSIRNCIWDRYFAPTPNKSIISGAITGGICAVYVFFDTYKQYHKFWGSIAAGVVYFVMAFISCFALMSFAVILYNNKKRKLENEEEEEE